VLGEVCGLRNAQVRVPEQVKPPASLAAATKNIAQINQLPPHDFIFVLLSALPLLFEEEGKANRKLLVYPAGPVERVEQTWRRQFRPDSMSSSKNFSAASGQRQKCDQCSQTLVDPCKLRRHKREQHAEKKTCPVPDCKYKGTKRIGLLMGEGSKPGHLEKKHGLNREGMPTNIRFLSKRTVC
jgi:hypothetical protein